VIAGTLTSTGLTKPTIDLRTGVASVGTASADHAPPRRHATLQVNLCRSARSSLRSRTRIRAEAISALRGGQRISHPILLGLGAPERALSRIGSSGSRRSGRAGDGRRRARLRDP
jgi:hypothetical protein